MSCDCVDGSSVPLGPCGPSNNQEESIASALSNLELSLFGIFTKTIVNGRATWSAPCGANSSIPAVPRGTSEGFICYVLRLIGLLGFFWKGVWNVGTQYQINDVVLYGVNNDTLYVCTQMPPVGTLPTNASYFDIFIHSPSSTVPGPQGPAGSPGSSSVPTYAFVTATTNYTATNNDCVIFCESSGSPFVVTLPLISSLSSGKYYKIRTDGAQTITITPTSTDTINGASNYSITLAGESVEIISKNSGNWFIF